MRLPLRILLFVGLVLAMALPTLVAAASYTSAMNAYERQDYHTALRQFTALSHDMDPHAQYMLGMMYAAGEGTARDQLLAYRWLHLAASQGIAPARELKRTIGSQLSPGERRWAKELLLVGHHANSGGMLEYGDPATVLRVQRQLARLGYFHHQLDGVMGKKTRRAIRRYQKDRRLLVDGKITLTLMESLYGAMHSPGHQDNQGIYRERPGTRDQQAQAQLLKKLRKLIRQGKKRHAADPWFLRRLEEIVHNAEQGQGTKL
ncbi:peptidoglycan-binding protein [Desulfogranum mediterraneum]|uniref:peptidoglycan-binding protein n=1 Tax=Desulfogranum mediterraneum TaxID=160661 RepID=UPI000407C6C9|nr:peptidoglycan-binding protein [Desulfogranum mediterraneum]